MKKQLALLAVSMTTSLVADSCCEPCKPCCVPQPRAPICCECYTPAYDDMQCDWDVFVDVEFLYWYGRENNLAYAIKEQTLTSTVNAGVSTFALSHNRYKHLQTKWDPGVRVGVGYKMCDGWDISLYWTYYHNEKRNSTSVAAFTGTAPDLNAFALANPWQNYAVANFFLDHVSAKWDFHINQIDLEMGRKYFLSKCFVMRPYMGLRGAWSHTKFQTKGARNGSTVTTEMKDSFKNRNWGVGLLGGFQPSWYFDDEFSLFGEASFALLWGKFKEKNTERYQFTSVTTGTTDYSSSSKDDFFGMQPVIDLALGLRWETNWCENRYAFAIDAGWEHHIWFDYNTRTKLFDDNASFVTSGGTAVVVDKKAEEITNNVAFGGFVLRARFDF